jgi:general secretion pathway protein I
MTRHPRLRRRPGWSLLEVVVAMAILLFSVVAISHLVSIGSDRALEVQQRSIGSMLAQRKLAELMIGATPLGSSGYTAFTDDGMDDWQWKVEANQNSVNGLWNVEVSVKYDPPDNAVPSLVVEIGQMVLDPTLRGSNLDAPPTQATNSSTDSSTTDNSSSGNNASPSGAGGAPGGMSGNKGGTPGNTGNKGGPTGNNPNTGKAGNNPNTGKNNPTPNNNGNKNATPGNTGKGSATGSGRFGG